MRGIFNHSYAIFFSDFLYKSICNGYPLDLPQPVEMILMSTYNICFYNELD